MEIVGGLTFALAFVAIAVAAARRFRSDLFGRLSSPSPGLKADSESRMGLLLSAWRGGRSHVERYSAGEDERGLRFVLEGLHPDVTLLRRSHSRGTFGPPVEVGDPELERGLLVTGSRAHALALLTVGTRKAIRDFLLGTVRIGQLTLEDGTLTVDVPTAGFEKEHPGLPQAAAAAVELAKLLAPSIDVVARLAENVARDPLPGVRLASVRALVAEHRSDPRTRAALLGGLRDVDSSVRLEAAIGSGAQGRETLVALAIDTAIDDTVGARALAALGADLPLDRMGPLVYEAAKDPAQVGSCAGRIRALVAALGSRASDEGLALLERLARDAHDSYGPLVIDTIVASHRPRAEGPLIRALLGQDQGREPLAFIAFRYKTQDAAARHLGVIGTLDAIQPLKQIVQRHGGGLASTARQSIAKIQERLAGARGQLALTDGEAGRLSEATDPTGRLSLPGEED